VRDEEANRMVEFAAADAKAREGRCKAAVG
jgi:hypothetical protein